MCELGQVGEAGLSMATDRDAVGRGALVGGGRGAGAGRAAKRGPGGDRGGDGREQGDTGGEECPSEC